MSHIVYINIYIYIYIYILIFGWCASRTTQDTRRHDNKTCLLILQEHMSCYYIRKYVYTIHNTCLLVARQKQVPILGKYALWLYICSDCEIFVFDLMSAAIQPQVSIIWGIKDPSTKYPLALTQYALSATRGLFFQPEILKSSEQK